MFFIFLGLIGPGIAFGKIYAFHFIFIIIMSFAFINIIQNKYKVNLELFFSKYSFLFAFWICWSLLSFLWSDNYSESFKYLIYLIIGVICIYQVMIFVKNKKNLDRFIIICKWVLIINIFLAIGESLGIFRWPFSPFSKYAIIFGREPEQFNYGAMMINNLYPPTGMFGNPNNLSVFCTVASPFLIAYSKGTLQKIGIISIIWIIVTSGSRGSIIALSVGIMFYFFYVKKKSNEIISLLILIFLFAVFSILYIKSENDILNIIVGNLDFFDIYKSEDIQSLSSAGIRIALLMDGWNAFLETKGLGLGAGGTFALQSNLGGYSNGIARLHNFWLEILFDWGVVLFFFVVFWFVFILRKINSIMIFSKQEWRKKFAKPLFISIIIFIASIPSVSTAIYFLPMWFFFGLITSFVSMDEK